MVFLFRGACQTAVAKRSADNGKHVVQRSLVKATALAIPLLELVLALFLLSGIASRAAAIVSALVLAVFTIVLTVMWRRGVKGCGCFGEDNNAATTGSGIIRNLILIVLAALVAVGPEGMVLYGPDVATLLGRMTVIAGAFCLWPCIARGMAEINLQLCQNMNSIWITSMVLQWVIILALGFAGILKRCANSRDHNAVER